MSDQAMLAPGGSAYFTPGRATQLVAKHPKRTAFILAGLTAVVAIFAVKHWKAKMKLEACQEGRSGAGKSGMLTRYSNHKMGLQNSLWHMGNGDSGRGSTVDYVPDSIPQASKALVQHDLRPDVIRVKMARARRMGAARRAAGIREGMYPAPCKPGDVQFASDDGKMVCGTPAEAAAANDPGADDDDMDVYDAYATAGCGKDWDPAAVADTQALSALGAIEGSTSAEERLMTAADGGDTLSDQQLNTLLHQGVVS